MVCILRKSWALLTLYLLQGITSAGSIEFCSASVLEFDIATTEDATELSKALNCSGGGTFDVRWGGVVVVNETIALTDGSVVDITGIGSDAVVDGNGITQLFSVSNATLLLTDISLDNAYGAWGGAVWASGDDAVVFCAGTTTFKGNSAGYGAAMYIEDGANASCTGLTNFTANDANIGGALYSKGGRMKFTGETTFEHGFAREGMSAIYASSSEVSWSGVMSFYNNTASSSFDRAGAVSIYNSLLSWQGKTSFNDCSGGYGGAFSASGSSNVSWGGETEFCGNSAGLYGGAVYIGGSSNVTWTGKTLFCNNNAHIISTVGIGGAIQVENAAVSWTGTTNFVNNDALFGGAIHANNEAIVTGNGITVFSNNSAATGGAVYAESGAAMDWGGTITFANNFASLNGGAIFFGSEVSLKLGVLGTNLKLTGNIANIAGGALYQESISKGLTWQGVSFISNSALIGGAVYSLASGTAIDGATEFPTTYIGCVFFKNTAEASGGAMESAAGKDEIYHTTFDGNTAGGLGGGLRLAGTAILSRCEFVGNGAGGTGPAVASISTTSVALSSFKNNSLLCAPGTFLNFNDEENSTQASEDYFLSVCDGCDPCTGGCELGGTGTQECILALENTNSSGIDDQGAPITLLTLNILPGYWRSVSSTATIRPCWNEYACLGGVTDGTEDCAEGYKGPYCAVCEDNYAPSFAYTCNECSSGEGVAFGVVTLLVAFAAAVAVVFHLASTTVETKNICLRQLLHTLPVQGLKTVLVAWQILTQFDSVANVTYAGVYGQFLDGISSVINLDVGLVLSAGCMAKTNFHERLIVATLGPLLAMGVLGVSFQITTRRNLSSDETLQTIWRKHFSMALLVTFLVYSSVSSTVFRAFDCETLEDGTEYLRADYSIECTSAKHKALEVYAGFMILLYPIGIPVLYSIILFKNRETLLDRRLRSVQQMTSVKVTADLWKPYTPARFYYEVIECARRVTLTGVIVFIYPNTASQVAVTLMLSFVFVLVSEVLAPFASKQDAWLSRVAHIVVFTSMFQALMVKVDVSDESSDSQQVFGGVLLAVTICMVAAVIAEAALVVASVRGRANSDLEESVAPGIRSTTSARSIVKTWDTIENDKAPMSEVPAS